MLELLMPDAAAIKAAHGRLSVLLPSRFFSPLKISADIERTAAKGEAKVRVMTALADGAELTVDDIREECDMGREAARCTLSDLVAQGSVEVRTTQMHGQKVYRLRHYIPPIINDVSDRKRPNPGTRLSQVLEAAEAQPGSFMTQDIMRATGLPFERSQNFIALLIQQGWIRRLSLIGRGRPGIYEVIK
jgi:hypothetical protein